MKKVFLVILVLFMVMATVQAQKAGSWHTGARGGLSIGFHSFSKDEFNALMLFRHWDPTARVEKTSSLNNFNGAYYIGYTIIDNLSLQGEFNFNVYQGEEIRARGYFEHLGFPFSPWSEKGDFEFSTLDIPILVKYSFSSPMSFGVLGGLYLSFPLGRADFSSNFGHEAWKIKGLGFGATVGGFAGIPLGSAGRFVGDVRLLFDFTPTEVEYYYNWHFSVFYFPVRFISEVITRRGLALTLGYEFSF